MRESRKQIEPFGFLSRIKILICGWGGGGAVIAVEMTLDVQKLKKMFKRSVSSISGHSLSSNLCCLLNGGGGGRGGVIASFFVA